MKTNFFITTLLAIALLTGCSGSEEKSGNVITFTTARAVGKTITLAVDADKADQADVWIDLNNNGVKDTDEAFTGFGYSAKTEFTLGAQTISIYGNVTKLDCDDNALTALNPSKNTKLTELYCVDNDLTALDVSKNTKLTVLSCDGNALTTLNVSNNPELTKLWCSENQISALDVSGNSKLANLHCDENRLATLDVSRNPELIELYCYDNELSTLDLSKNPELTYLFCGGNQFVTLDVSSNPKLTMLTCYDNALTALDVSKNSELYNLWCSDNKIKGEEMTALIAGLPDRTGMEAGKLKVIDSLSPDEQNEFTDTQKLTAAEKNWSVE